MKLVGLDIGTTTICGLVVETGTGDILSVVARPNTAQVAGAAPWEALQDPRIILEAVRAILDGFLGKWRDIGGIGVAGQMHGILYVDSAGAAVSPLYTWQDGRGDLADENGTSTAARLSRSLGSRAGHRLRNRDPLLECRPRARPGRRGITVHGPRLGGDDAVRARRTADGLLECGEPRGIRPGGTGFPPRRHGRDRDRCAPVPEVTDSFPALGEARPGVPVFTAAGDNQASFLGSVRDARATVLFNVGTGSQVSVPIQTAAAIPGLDVRPFPFGGHLAVGAALCGGSAYALLRSFFERTLRLFAPGAPGVSWDVMNAVTGPRPHGGHPFQRHAL